MDTQTFEVAARPAKVCVFESPTNPTLRIVDVAAVAAACRKAGTVSLMDSTFGPPALQQPLAMGVDVVMHSATKYLNGHSDVSAGVLAGPAETLDRIWDVGLLTGAGESVYVTQVAKLERPTDVTAFAVSIEPRGGSKSPTGPIVLVGPLKG